MQIIMKLVNTSPTLLELIQCTNFDYCNFIINGNAISKSFFNEPQKLLIKTIVNNDTTM